MQPDFEDERGTITDLAGPVDAITRITTVEGAVRGNHVHHHTTQWTLVLSGRLLVVQGDEARELRAGDTAVDLPGVPHAWKALTDVDCLVWVKGPRAGGEYESDTERLETPLLR